MNLKDLSQIDIKDLKSIDLSQIKDAVQKKPEIIINFLLIVASLFVIIYVFTGGQKKSTSLQNNIVKMKAKQEVVESLKSVKEKKEQFIENFPKTIPSDRLVDKLSEFAVEHNVQVVSFLPAKQKSNDILEYTIVTLTVSSAEYQDIALFIKDIEESPYAWRVERWAGGLQQKANTRKKDAQQTEELQNLIVAELDIGSIKLKP